MFSDLCLCYTNVKDIVPRYRSSRQRRLLVDEIVGEASRAREVRQRRASARSQGR